MSIDLHDVFEEIISQIKIQKGLTPTLYNSLYFLFGSRAAAALDLLDKNMCICFVAKPSHRRFWQVAGGKTRSKDKYLCSPSYCFCADFEYSVVTKKTELFCKHQLAFLVGEALGKCIIREVSDEEFDKHLKEVFETTS